MKYDLDRIEAMGFLSAKERSGLERHKKFLEEQVQGSLNRVNRINSILKNKQVVPAGS